MNTGGERTLVLLIPTNAVGLIIGKAGQFLKYIGYISGATMRLQSFDEIMHGIQERAVFVTGHASAIIAAVQILLLRLQVPLNSVSSVSEDPDELLKIEERRVMERQIQEQQSLKTRLEGQQQLQYQQQQQMQQHFHPKQRSYFQEEQHNQVNLGMFQGEQERESTEVDGSPRPLTDDAAGEQRVLQWIIPKSSCGLLIGKNGSRIKFINENSGAWVKVAHHEEVGPDIGECFIYIRGTAAQTANALMMVKRIAGGRPNKPTDSDSCVVTLPYRALGEILIGDAARGIEPLHEAMLLYDVTVRIETIFITGISATKLFLKGGTEELRQEAMAVLSERIDLWRSQHLFNDHHFPEGFSQSVSGAVSGGFASNDSSLTNDENSANSANSKLLKEEMCLLLLFSYESAQLLTPFPNGKNIFSPVTEAYDLTMEVLPDSALSSNFVNNVRVVALMGHLGSLLVGLSPIQDIFAEHGAQPISSVSLISQSPKNAHMMAGSAALPGMIPSTRGGRSSKIIDQIGTLVQDLLRAMKSQNMMSDPPLMRFLLAYDELQRTHASTQTSNPQQYHRHGCGSVHQSHNMALGGELHKYSQSDRVQDPHHYRQHKASAAFNAQHGSQQSGYQQQQREPRASHLFPTSTRGIYSQQSQGFESIPGQLSDSVYSQNYHQFFE